MPYGFIYKILFPNGKHYIGPHSDDTRQLSSNSTIASISLGASRKFILTPKKGLEGKSLKINLIIMN